MCCARPQSAGCSTAVMPTPPHAAEMHQRAAHRQPPSTSTHTPPCLDRLTAASPQHACWGWRHTLCFSAIHVCVAQHVLSSDLDLHLVCASSTLRRLPRWGSIATCRQPAPPLTLLAALASSIHETACGSPELDRVCCRPPVVLSRVHLVFAVTVILLRCTCFFCTGAAGAQRCCRPKLGTPFVITSLCSLRCCLSLPRCTGTPATSGRAPYISPVCHCVICVDPSSICEILYSNEDPGVIPL